LASILLLSFIAFSVTIWWSVTIPSLRGLFPASFQTYLAHHHTVHPDQSVKGLASRYFSPSGVNFYNPAKYSIKYLIVWYCGRVVRVVIVAATI
jgi:hypothetical protein